VECECGLLVECECGALLECEFRSLVESECGAFVECERGVLGKDTDWEIECALVNILQCFFVHHKFHKILPWKGIRASMVKNWL